MLEPRRPLFGRRVGAIALLAFPIATSCSSAPVAPTTPKLGGVAGYETAQVEALVTSYDAEVDALKRKALRTRILDMCLATIDGEFARWIGSLGQRRQDQSLALDVVDLGADLVATAVPTANTKAFWTVISGSASGTRQALDKDVFFDKSMPALVATMQAERAKVRERIDAGLAKQDADYGLQRGLGDAWNYYIAGTLSGSMQSIVNAAGEKEKRADGKRDKLREIDDRRIAMRERIDAGRGVLRQDATKNAPVLTALDGAEDRTFALAPIALTSSTSLSPEAAALLAELAKDQAELDALQRAYDALPEP